MGIDVSYNQDGKKILSHYTRDIETGSDNLSLEDFGINENKLLKEVAEISGDAYFRNSCLSAEDFKNIEVKGKIIEN
jgi:hypothetical protein